MKIADLITWFENWGAWQKAGITVVGKLSQSIIRARVLVCLTPTLAVIQEVIALQNSGVPVNLILPTIP